MNHTDKKEKKTFRKWIVLSLTVGFVGAILGFVASRNSEIIDQVLQALGNTKDYLAIPLFLVFLITTVVGYAYVIVNYRKAKALVEAGYDDEAYEKAEETLSRASVVANILTGNNYLMFGVCLFATGMSENSDMETQQIILSMLTIVIFIVAMFLSISMQNKMVGLDKKMNPEKKGNVFDKKFAKEWIASCDEAEKSLIYESAYTAYRVAITLSSSLWGIALIGMMIFHTGVLAVVICSLMMIVLIATYSVTAYKLQYKK